MGSGNTFVIICPSISTILSVIVGPALGKNMKEKPGIEASIMIQIQRLMVQEERINAGVAQEGQKREHHTFRQEGGKRRNNIFVTINSYASISTIWDVILGPARVQNLSEYSTEEVPIVVGIVQTMAFRNRICEDVKREGKKREGGDVVMSYVLEGRYGRVAHFSERAPRGVIFFLVNLHHFYLKKLGMMPIWVTQ